MRDRDPVSPTLFPPGTEPAWVVGYERTDDGWRPLDSASEAALDRQAIASIAADGGIPHEQVMAALRARREAMLATAAK